FGPTSIAGASLLIERTASNHHPVPPKAVRKLGTAEVCLTVPIFLSDIGLYPPHVVACAQSRPAIKCTSRFHSFLPVLVLLPSHIECPDLPRVLQAISRRLIR